MLREYMFKCPNDGEQSVVQIQGATPEKPITPTCPYCGEDMRRVFDFTPHFFKQSDGGTRG